MEQDILNTDGRRGYIWVLDPAAIAAGGVESTTRYRKVGPVKKTVESDVLAAPRRSTHKVRKASLGKRAPAHAYNSHSLRHSLERAMSSVSLDDNQMEIDSSPVATTRGNLSTYEALVQAQSNLNHHHYHNQWFNTQTYFQQPGYGCGQDDTMTEPHLVSGYAASPSSATIPSPGVSPELSQAAPTLKQEYNFEDIEGCTPGYEIADLYFPSHELPDANSPYIPVGLESHYRNHGGL